MSRRGRSSTVSEGTSRQVSAAAAAANAAPRLPRKSSGRRDDGISNNPRLRGDRTVNGSAAHPTPYDHLGKGTGPAAAGRRWAPADKRYGVDEGRRGGGGYRGGTEEVQFLPEGFSEPVSGPVPGLGPRPFPERYSHPFTPEWDGGKGNREVYSGTRAVAEVGNSGREEMQAIDDKPNLTLTSSERAALAATVLQGRRVRISHGEIYLRRVTRYGQGWGTVGAKISRTVRESGQASRVASSRVVSADPTRPAQRF